MGGNLSLTWLWYVGNTMEYCCWFDIKLMNENKTVIIAWYNYIKSTAKSTFEHMIELELRILLVSTEMRVIFLSITLSKDQFKFFQVQKYIFGFAGMISNLRFSILDLLYYSSVSSNKMKITY